MGLDDNQWERLLGESTVASNIDAIIHNGAVMNWNADYNKLYTPNVESTVELLKMTAASKALPKFVYVSGGAKHDANIDLATTASYISYGNGYVQTKFLSEIVLLEIASKLPANQNRLSVVKPGAIIGTTSEGIANIDDYLWRVVAAAAALKAYPVESDDQWLSIADVQTVSENIVEQILKPSHVSPFVDMLEGVSIPAFWELVVDELGEECSPISWEEWIRRAHTQMDEVGQEHPLWPVQHFLGEIGVPLTESQGTLVPQEHTRSAIRSNVRYMKRVGFILAGDGVVPELQEDVITRTERHRF